MGAPGRGSSSLWIFVVVAAAASSITGGEPPREIPVDLRDDFTMQGKIPVESYYVDDSNGGEGTHYQFPRLDIDAMLLNVQQQKANMQRLISLGIGLQNKPSWIYQALLKYPIEGLEVVVFGSMEPYFECICLAHGAKTVTTVEYNKLTFEHPQLKTLTVEEFHQKKHTLKFDAAFSISSFDHDGLGRYGDPINPNGDVEAMEMVKGVLRPHGKFYFSVPIGPDVLAWNLHRRYGRIRLPLMLQQRSFNHLGWRTVTRVGWHERKLDAPKPYMVSYEPLFVLTPDGDDSEDEGEGRSGGSGGAEEQQSEKTHDEL
eukprot:jgi/Bigna1/87546/estExt_fgenesh1_pg.C_210159